MTENQRHLSRMSEVSNALVRLHKAHFGRGPTHARSLLVGTDTLLCMLEDVMLPAEQKLVNQGQEKKSRQRAWPFRSQQRRSS
jgi:uncharacterized protein YbcI